MKLKFVDLKWLVVKFRKLGVFFGLFYKCEIIFGYWGIWWKVFGFEVRVWILVVLYGCNFNYKFL